MTNFSKGLNKHLQMMQNRSLPAALEVTGNASNPSDPMLPSVYSALVQFLSGGFVGPYVSYFASVPVVTGGFPANSVDQVWGAYNGFSHGNGSLQIGRFPTPIFAPWTSQSLSLSGYGVATLPVGLNASTLADNRWGASYTQFGHLGLIGNVSYLNGTGPLERAFSNGAEGTAWTGSLQYLSPESRWSGGFAGLRGSYPLPSGATDSYTRARRSLRTAVNDTNRRQWERLVMTAIPTTVRLPRQQVMEYHSRQFMVRYRGYTLIFGTNIRTTG